MRHSRLPLVTTPLCVLFMSALATFAKADDFSYGSGVFPTDRDLAAKARRSSGNETGDPARIRSGHYLTTSPEVESHRHLFSRPFVYAAYPVTYDSFYPGYYGSGDPFYGGYGSGFDPYGYGGYGIGGYGGLGYGPFGGFGYGGYGRAGYGRYGFGGPFLGSSFGAFRRPLYGGRGFGRFRGGFYW